MGPRDTFYAEIFYCKNISWILGLKIQLFAATKYWEFCEIEVECDALSSVNLILSIFVVFNFSKYLFSKIIKILIVNFTS